MFIFLLRRWLSLLEVGFEMIKKSDLSQEVSGFVCEGRPTEVTCKQLQLNCYYSLFCGLWTVPFAIDPLQVAQWVSHTILGQSNRIVCGHVIWKIIPFAGEDSRPESGNVICSLSAVFGEKPRGSPFCCLGNTGKISIDWRSISSHIMFVAKNKFDIILFLYKIMYMYIKCATRITYIILFTNHLCGWPWTWS